MNSCEMCKYLINYDGEDADNGGFCTRYPPQIVLQADAEGFVTTHEQPQVAMDDVCGEFQSKESSKPWKGPRP